MIPTVLYVLMEPDTGEIRYVGKTAKTLASRLSSHLHDPGRCHRTNWIRGLKEQGQQPVIESLFEIDGDWEKYERAYIQIFRSAGCRLVNQTDGGDCGPRMRGEKNPFFGKKHSAQVLSQISATNKGRKHTPEHVEACRHPGEKNGNFGADFWGEKNPFYGRKHSLETREKMRRAKLGKYAGEKNPNFGKRMSDEQKAKISATKRAKFMKSRELQSASGAGGCA